MSRHELNDPNVNEDDDQRLEDQALENDENKDEANNEAKGAIGWFISIGMHALFALIFYYAVFTAKKEDQELPPMRIVTIDPPPIKEDKKELDRAVENKVEINVQSEADVAAPISNLEVPLEEKTTTEEESEAEMNKGREEAVASSETGSTGAFMAIGAGGGSAGMFGNRNGGGKRRALAKGGGTRASESAVDAALRWFKRHQSPNGMWDVEKYTINCIENPKCEPGQQHKSSNANIACTGFAVLCFLGAGYDHKTPNAYKTTIEKGSEYLRSVQSNEGVLGLRNYEQAVATMAFAEAYAMTNDESLKAPGQKGIDILLSRQAKGNGGEYDLLAWNYQEARPERQDCSVTGWCIMALKSGLAGGLNVGEGMMGAKNWLEKHWKASNPEWQKITDPYTHTSKFSYTWNAITNETNPDKDVAKKEAKSDRYPMGALSAVFLGHHAGDIILESLLNSIMNEQLYSTYENSDLYYIYYNTLAVFQAGGPRWEKWNGSMRDMIVNAQRKGEGCFDGSWDWANTRWHGNEVGRVLSTAFMCLSLEVYYRYKQVGAKETGVAP